VIADHIRACAFLVAMADYRQRGARLLLRRIVRGAATRLPVGCREPSSRLGRPTWRRKWARPTPNWSKGCAHARRCCCRGAALGETLKRNEEIREAALGQLRSGDARMLDGETALVLYDTPRIPVDLTADYRARARLHGRHGRGRAETMERKRGQAPTEGTANG